MAHFRTPALVLLLGLGTAVGSANTYTVTSTADSGAGTLRQAILDANANPGADTIVFNILGSGVHTISPASALPAITGAVTIDGYTQPGSSANSNPADTGLNTVLQIEIDCTSVTTTSCWKVDADDVTLKGLVMNRATQWEVDVLDGHQNFALEGCFLGTNPSGTQVIEPFHGGVEFHQDHQNGRIGGTNPAARNLLAVRNGAGTFLGAGPPGFVNGLVAGNLIGTDITGKLDLNTSTYGVNMLGGSNTVIGGTSPDARNVINGGINLGSGSPGTFATGNFVRGNFIGTDVSGTVEFYCGNECVRVSDQNNTIGGSAPGAGNRIGGGSQNGAGIRVQPTASGTIIQGNSIGTDETGVARLYITGYGILANQVAGGVTIGGINPGEGNVISNCAFAGVGVQGSGTATIRGNSIFDNPGTQPVNGLAIDLFASSPNGVNYNDAGDADTGPNGFQNYPLITSVVYGASSTTVNGTLSSAPSTVYDVDFYGNPACARRPQDVAEGRNYLGTQAVATDGSGEATFSVVLPVAVDSGSAVTATATDPSGNTSELSPRFAIVSTPPSGGSAANITITGLAFEDGATVTVGGLPATNVVVTDAHTITATTPSLPYGSANDIVVSNPGGDSGTIPRGYLASFNDVPPNNQFNQAVMRLVGNGVTAGVGNGLYGAGNPTLRQQMAVFLLKAEHGSCYVPPPCTGVFPDVPCSSNFAPWIERFAAEGITGGCGGGNYCPTNAVRRDQMAVFILKAEHGPAYTPPPCVGVFDDVPCPSPFADWIEQLATENITGGCGGNNYCPSSSVTRAQMAVFLMKAFSLP